MIIVTGAAGFIGSNLVKSLNLRGKNNILTVDNLENGKKFRNLVDCQILDYVDKRDFLQTLNEIKAESCDYAKEHDHIPSDFSLPYDNSDDPDLFIERSLAYRLHPHTTGRKIEAIFHLGACSSTTEWNGRYIMQNNYDYSKTLLDFCIKYDIPLIYASSASVYGSGQVFKEDLQYEKPLNMYGYSKFLFDQYVRQLWKTHNKQSLPQIAGFRYFNVYGPREQHKGTMASVAFHCHNQMLDQGKVNLFAGYDGYGNGEQRRDFVYVADVVDVNLWFLDHPEHSGVFNVGTGRSQTFKEVANAVLSWHKSGKINYIDFPDHLKGCYQSFTQADISALRAIGYDKDFKTVEQGVKAYLDWLQATHYDPAIL